MDLPHTAPAFDAAAAQWAAGYLHAALQLALVRELDEAAVAENLPDWPDAVTPAAAYAVDLTFRYLPDQLRLA